MMHNVLLFFTLFVISNRLYAIEIKVKNGKFYVKAIKKALSKNNKKNVEENIQRYMHAPRPWNAGLCEVLANAPTYLEYAIKQGLKITPPEVFDIIRSTHKKSTIDVLIKNDIAPSAVWLAYTFNHKIADYLLQKGVNVNEEITHHVTPLTAVLIENEPSAQQKEYYIFLRHHNAMTAPVSAYLDQREKQVCNTPILQEACWACRSQKHLLKKYEESYKKRYGV